MKKVISLFVAFQILLTAGISIVLAEDPLPPPQEEESQEEPNEPLPQPDPEPEPQQEEPVEEENPNQEQPGPFSIKINEILADPIEPEANGEFIELYNSGDLPIDLSGWTLDDEVLDDNYAYIFDNPDLNYVLEPGSYLSLFRPETGIVLNNDGDAVYLFDDQMDEIDYFVFESSSVGRPWGRNIQNSEEWILLPNSTPNAENAFNNNPPIADIQIQGGTGGMKINVTGENSSDPDGDKLSYLWEFEPGIFNEAENPTTYEFQSPGNKTIKLTVTDEFGLSGEAMLDFIATNGEQMEEQEEDVEENDEEDNDEQDEEINENAEEVSYPKYLLINEFMADPVGTDGDREWIELYNSTAEVIDLSAWYLDDEEGATSPFKIPEGTKFNSKSYLLFKGPALNLSLKNSADVVRLLDPTKKEIERIEYAESKEGLSYARSSQNNFIWTSIPTPNTENKFPLPPKAYSKGVIKFESVLPDPEGADTSKEKILLKNTSNEPIDLTKWKLANNSTEKELVNITIAASGKRELSSEEFGLTLKNTDEILSLLDPTGQLIDEISWKTSSPDVWLFNTNSLQSGMKILVKEVADGDTFKIVFEGKNLVVRLLGVDTPETTHPFKPVEYYGRQASDYLKNLLTGKEVKLNFEENKVDGYGRVLAYVYLNDLWVNAEVIKQGYGYAYTKYPFQYLNEFTAYQQEAKSAGRGLWADSEVAKEIEKTIQEDLAEEEILNENGTLVTTEEKSNEFIESIEKNDEADSNDEDKSFESENKNLECHSEFLKIESFLPYPKKGSEEYIKLINTGEEEICLSGWQLDDVEGGGSKPFQFKEGTIKAGEIKEFGKEMTKLSLNNSNDCVTLINPEGNVVDQICYEKTKEGEVFNHKGGSLNSEKASTTDKKKTSTKTSNSNSTSAKHTFSRESSAYRSELINHSFLGRILGMDETEKMLIVELEDKKIIPVSYAHSLFDMKMIKAILKLEKMVMFEVYQGEDLAYLISIYDPDNLKGSASERSKGIYILFIVPALTLGALAWKKRELLKPLKWFREKVN